jgi:hypothetical protein
LKSLSSGPFPDIDSEFEREGLRDSLRIWVRYRTDKRIKIVYKQNADNGRPSLRAVIGYG